MTPEISPKMSKRSSGLSITTSGSFVSRKEFLVSSESPGDGGSTIRCPLILAAGKILR